MELEVVQNHTVLSRINESMVFVTLLILLPLEIEKSIGGIVCLWPDTPEPKDSSDELLIIALAQTKLDYRTSTVSGLLE